MESLFSCISDRVAAGFGVFCSVIFPVSVELFGRQPDVFLYDISVDRDVLGQLSDHKEHGQYDCTASLNNHSYATIVDHGYEILVLIYCL